MVWSPGRIGAFLEEDIRGTDHYAVLPRDTKSEGGRTMEMMVATDKDHRAVRFFRANLGEDFWERYQEQFQTWLNGQNPSPGNFARFIGIRIPEEVLEPSTAHGPNPARTWLDRQRPRPS